MTKRLVIDRRRMAKTQNLLRWAMAQMGSKGGKRSAQSLTKKQRVERARKAGIAGAKARWGEKGGR